MAMIINSCCVVGQLIILKNGLRELLVIKN